MNHAYLLEKRRLLEHLVEHGFLLIAGKENHDTRRNSFNNVNLIWGHGFSLSTLRMTN